MKNPAKGAPYMKKKPKGAKVVGQTTMDGRRFSKSENQRKKLFSLGVPFTMIYRYKGRYLRERMNA